MRTPNPFPPSTILRLSMFCSSHSFSFVACVFSRRAHAASVVSPAFFTRSHIVLAYNTNQLTVVHLQRPNARSQGPEKIANMDPRIFHVIIPGATERKLSRHLTVNASFDLFVVWTQSSQNEVYPWRPTIRDQDRANIHVFKIKG